MADRVKKIGLPVPNIIDLPLSKKYNVQLELLKWERAEDKIIIYKWLYKNATIYLKRKKDRFDKAVELWKINVLNKEKFNTHNNKYSTEL
jgi:hypothetical protein